MRIVFSADDFGGSHEMNMVIDYAMRNETVRSAALLMRFEYPDEAIGLAIDGNYILMFTATLIWMHVGVSGIILSR